MEPCKQDLIIRDRLIVQAKHGERIDDMEDYRAKQNGALLRVERKIDDLLKWIMATAVVMSGGFILGLVTWLVQKG